MSCSRVLARRQGRGHGFMLSIGYVLNQGLRFENVLLTWRIQGYRIWEQVLTLKQNPCRQHFYDLYSTLFAAESRSIGEMAAAMATASTSMTCALFPMGGRISLASGLQSENKRHCQRKAGPAHITAKFELKPPPYALNALEPLMSKDTLEYHWGKHHRAYVDNLNKQIVGTELDVMSLEDVVVTAYNKGDVLPAFNNAAQAWNHEFFWGCMTPGGGGKPSGELLQLIERDFGSFEKFVQEFKSAAAMQFGSGWAWLVYKVNRLDVENAVNPCPSEEDKKLIIVKSPNAVNPLVWNYYPLLTIDVWEHAYYLDFQNRRPDYISTFIEKLVSWEAVSARLEAAKAHAAAREKEDERKRDEAEQKPGSEPLEMYVDSDTDDSEAV